MPYNISERHGAAVLSLKGKFRGSLEGKAFQSDLEQLVERGQNKVVVDLTGADFLDSSGIGTLLSARDLMKSAGGDVRLAGMQTRIRGLFLMTKLLGSVFTDYESVDAAALSYTAADA